jgi:hypothetical protein
MDAVDRAGITAFPSSTSTEPARQLILGVRPWNEPILEATLRSYLVQITVQTPITLSFVDKVDDPEALFRFLNDLMSDVSIEINKLAQNRFKEMEQQARVSPLLVLLSLAFWGWMWGVIGMILAVPLTVIGKIILENIRVTKPLAILISNE